jgi:SpoVK/Ycf46/Vps4 family AAA+-type ATPase
MLYLGVSDNHTAQLKIMQALTRKFKLSPDMDLARVADSCPFNYTGADFYALCSDAILKAMTRVAWEVDGRIGASFSHDPLFPSFPASSPNPSLVAICWAPALPVLTFSTRSRTQRKAALLDWRCSSPHAPVLPR